MINSPKTMDEFLATNSKRKITRSGANIVATGIRSFGYAKYEVTTQNAPKVPVTSQIGTTYWSTLDFVPSYRKSNKTAPITSVINRAAKIANAA